MKLLKLLILIFTPVFIFCYCSEDSPTNTEKENSNKVLRLSNGNSYLKITHPDHPDYLTEYEPCQDGGNYEYLTIEVSFYCTGDGGYLISRPYGGGWSSGNVVEIYSLFYNPLPQPSLEFKSMQGSSEKNHIAQASENLNQNAWNHVAGVYELYNSIKRIIINGKLVYDIEDIPFAGCDGKPLYIGASPQNKDSIFGYFNGYLDEIRIWSRALSVSDINENMNKTLKGNEPGLIGYWNFDDGTAKDKINSHLVPTLFGDAAIVKKVE